MKPKPRPLWLHVYGVGRVWRARVAARLGEAGKGRKVAPELGREVQSTRAWAAVEKAITAYRKEPRVCRLCGETWQCLRERKKTVCPRCQNRRRDDERRPGRPPSGGSRLPRPQDRPRRAQDLAAEDLPQREEAVPKPRGMAQVQGHGGERREDNLPE